MIPQAFLQAWSATASWPDFAETHAQPDRRHRALAAGWGAVRRCRCAVCLRAHLGRAGFPAQGRSVEIDQQSGRRIARTRLSNASTGTWVTTKKQGRGGLSNASSVEKQSRITDGLWQGDCSNSRDSLNSKNGYPTEHPVRQPIVEHVGVRRTDRCRRDRRHVAAKHAQADAGPCGQLPGAGV